jgi:hypothetical protein
VELVDERAGLNKGRHTSLDASMTTAAALVMQSRLAVAERVLYGLADAYTTKPHPPGCLVLNSSLPCSGDAEDFIWHGLAERRKASRIELRKRFKRFKSGGKLPADAHPDALAQYGLDGRMGHGGGGAIGGEPG